MEFNIPSILPEPDEILENKELGIVINKALDNLPERCRIIFSMKKQAGLSNKEIATKLKISAKTVENQMTIAFKKLIQFISDNWP
jgi:RNA polymerase sigma-70 factor (ECF subfamily)